MTRYRLKSCVWEITLACCFSCRYCGSGAGAAREGELTTQECASVAAQLAELGCERVSLIGGEVFLRPDWDEIASELTGRGVRTAIITNGWLFDADTIRRIRSAGIESVAVSLDSVEPVHDGHRQRGSFRRAAAAIDALHEGGIPVSVISTLYARAAAHIAEFYEWLRTKEIFAWQIQACSPMGMAADGPDWRFDHAEILRFVASHMHEAPFAMGVADNIGYFTKEEGSLRGNLSGRAVFQGCRAGLSAVGIDSVGNVRGCESLYDERFNEGSLRKKTLREIWEAPGAFAYNRDFRKELLSGKCAGCAVGAFCGGGCRAYNHFTHGKLYESLFCAREAGSKQKESMEPCR